MNGTIAYRRKIWCQEPDGFVQSIDDFPDAIPAEKIASGVVPYTTGWGVVSFQNGIEVRNYTLDLAAVPSQKSQTTDFRTHRLSFLALSVRFRLGNANAFLVIAPVRPGFYANAYRPWWVPGIPVGGPVPQGLYGGDCDYQHTFGTSPTVDATHQYLSFEIGAVGNVGLFDLHYVIGGA